MANLVVASVCNLRCPYCFAGDYPAARYTAPEEGFISIEAFEEHLDFIERSGIQEIRLIGGEPTLHPQFPELIRRARQRKKNIHIFSNGLLPKQALACLETLPADECTVLINMSATQRSGKVSPREQARRLNSLERLGQRALPGFTIDRPHFQLDFLLAQITASGCRKTVRLGLAQPVWSGNNVWLHPKQYPVAGRKIAEFAHQAAQAGVNVEFDCGFVRCMFSEIDLKALRQMHTGIGWHCNPILDIDLNGQALHCFPLANKIKAPITRQTTAASLRSAFITQASPYRAAGIYKECSACLFKRNGECPGGCLSNTLRRFHPASAQLYLRRNV